MAPTPLATRTSGTGPRLVLVHGFTQTSACWGAVATDLARDHQVVAVDLPGHGDSAGVDDHADLWASAELLGRTAGPATYVGYSLGGRVCLHLALARPDLVRALVLVGATGGIDDDDARRERRERDDRLADRLEAGGLEAFLEEWLALPLFAGLTPETDCRDARRANTAAGLAASLRASGTGRQQPLWDRLGAVDAPVLCLAGEHDRKFTAEARRLARAIGPSAHAEAVPGAGHTVHLEQPDAFLRIVRSWLARHPAPPTS